MADLNLNLLVHTAHLRELDVGRLAVTITRKTATCFKRLRSRMIAAGKQARLRRDRDAVIYRPRQGIPYAYERFKSAKNWLNEIFLDDRDFSSDCNMIDRLEKCLRGYDDDGFPRYEYNRMYLGFPNGVLRIDTCEFTPREAVDETLVVRKYFETEHIPNGEAPMFDFILRYQFSDEEVIRLFYVFIGRLFFRVNERDNWQALMYFLGGTGTGKSTIITVIMAMFSRIGTIDSSFDRNYGLGGLYEQELIVVDETPKNIKGRLAQQTWQNMVDGKLLAVRPMRKRPFVVYWKVPQLWAGVSLPDYDDDTGQVSRRALIWRFDNVVQSGNANMDQDIISSELSVIMFKALIAYRDEVERHGLHPLYEWCPNMLRHSLS